MNEEIMLSNRAEEVSFNKLEQEIVHPVSKPSRFDQPVYVVVFLLTMVSLGIVVGILCGIFFGV